RLGERGRWVGQQAASGERGGGQHCREPFAESAHASLRCVGRVELITSAKAMTCLRGHPRGDISDHGTCSQAGKRWSCPVTKSDFQMPDSSGLRRSGEEVRGRVRCSVTVRTRPGGLAGAGVMAIAVLEPMSAGCLSSRASRLLVSKVVFYQ